MFALCGNTTTCLWARHTSAMLNIHTALCLCRWVSLNALVCTCMRLLLFICFLIHIWFIFSTSINSKSYAEKRAADCKAVGVQTSLYVCVWVCAPRRAFQSECHMPVYVSPVSSMWALASSDQLELLQWHLHIRRGNCISDAPRFSCPLIFEYLSCLVYNKISGVAFHSCFLCAFLPHYNN